ncbi:hypothetical protein R1flu_004327 [Riccia fluitans]|uniref:Uncharacterized protein n=1 Tax=Riccia fluitans TaxID=41844 RepID=A0ABD1YQ95_9MARC
MTYFRSKDLTAAKGDSLACSTFSIPAGFVQSFSYSNQGFHACLSHRLCCKLLLSSVSVYLRPALTRTYNQASYPEKRFRSPSCPWIRKEKERESKWIPDGIPIDCAHFPPHLRNCKFSSSGMIERRRNAAEARIHAGMRLSDIYETLKWKDLPLVSTRMVRTKQVVEGLMMPRPHFDDCNSGFYLLLCRSLDVKVTLLSE